jgi:hypothetical protein
LRRPTLVESSTLGATELAAPDGCRRDARCPRDGSATVDPLLNGCEARPHGTDAWSSLIRSRGTAAGAALLTGLLFIVGGCGTGAEDEQQFDLAATRACLASKGLDVKRLSRKERWELAFSRDPSGGVLEIDFGVYKDDGFAEPLKLYSWLAFAANEREADQIAEDARLLAAGPFNEVVPEDAVKRKSNVVYFMLNDGWEYYPDDARSRIESCLTPSSAPA